MLFDGMPQKRLDPSWLRRSMGVVLQQSRVSPGNISRISSAIPAAASTTPGRRRGSPGLAEDIEAMPMGMRTTMMESGQGLSGGPRQRLLIARALVTRPRIVLFEEATSALDNRTQDIVTRTLAGLDATPIVIAHHLSTIERADRVVVLDRGRLVQSGRHADLLAQPGPFADLARRQLLWRQFTEPGGPIIAVERDDLADLDWGEVWASLGRKQREVMPLLALPDAGEVVAHWVGPRAARPSTSWWRGAMKSAVQPGAPECPYGSISAMTRAGADSDFHLAGNAISRAQDGISCRLIRFSI